MAHSRDETKHAAARSAPARGVETVARGGPALRQAIGHLTIETRGRGTTDITAEIRGWLAELGVGDGLLTVFLQHTSASLTIQENTDPDVRRDLLDALDRLAPEETSWRHDLEGPDDMPAHVKSSLTGVSLAVPVVRGRPDLGTWQAIYVLEHRRRPHRRTASLHYLGT